MNPSRWLSPFLDSLGWLLLAGAGLSLVSGSMALPWPLMLGVVAGGALGVLQFVGVRRPGNPDC